jgi:N utilization substance protein B
MSKITTRKKARKLLLQALYSWEISRTELATIEAHILAENSPRDFDVQYFSEIFHAIPAGFSELEEKFTPFISRPLADLDPIEKCILWLSSYELIYRPDVPYKVVINEGLELAKKFGGTDGHKFVNGVLDQLAAQVRPVEYKKPLN